MTKLLSLVQPNFRQGPTELNIYFLPYSVGCLWAYAEPHTDFQLDQLVWRREKIEELAQQLSTNNVVGFSTYVWNRNYNYKLAQRIKELNNQVLIVFGGPEPAVLNPDIFKLHPYIDVCIKSEGEIAFLKLLQGQALETIPGLVINRDGAPVDTGDANRIMDLSVLPSPYQVGVFDQIIKNNPNVTWNVTLETNRGCPYACTFCDWGSLTYNKVRQFPLSRVLADIEWLAQNGNGLLIADANFGMFLERDSVIVDKIIEQQQLHGRPDHMVTNWAKNQRADVFELVKRITEETSCLNNGLTVSVQTMTPGVLDIIKRTNLNQHKIAEIFQLALKNRVPVYTELILGLPGETLASWKHSMFEIMRAGNHHGIEVIQCQLLENAEMNLSQRSIFKMQTKDVIDYMSQSTAEDEGPVETIAVITETSTLSWNDMLEAQTWSSFMHTFHMYGFSTQIAKFLYKHHGIDYKEFYQELYQAVGEDPYIGKLLEKIKSHYAAWMTNGFLPHPVTEKISQTGINLLTSLTLLVHLEQQVDYVFDFVCKYVTDTYKIDSGIQQQLFDYQRNLIVTYDQISNYPTKTSYTLNLFGYLDQDTALEQACVVSFDFPEDKKMSATRFYENIYYGRKRAFGKSSIKITQHEIIR